MAAAVLRPLAENAGNGLYRLKFRHKKTACPGGFSAGVSRFTSKVVNS